MNKEKEMKKGKGNRQQKKRTKNRKRNEEQKRRERPGQDSGTKTRFGNQNKIRETNKIPGKTQRLPGISIEI